MKKINLRELYPDAYTTDFFVNSEGRPIRYLPLFQGLSQRTPDRVCQCRQHSRRRTRSAAARTAAHAKIRTVPLTSFQSHLETKNDQRIMWFIPHNTLVIRFTYCLYRSIPFFSSINFPSKISCNTCLHGIRCNLLTSDASITRKVVW